MRRASVVALLAVTLVSGCYSTTVRSGKPIGQVAPEANDRWHSGLVTGGVELSGPYDLERLCPDGWAEIHTETSLPNEVVELLTFHLYAPQTVRVTCAAPETPASAALAAPSR